MTATQASLYEHLFPLTTVMKQRVVDNFDGDTLNERWTFADISGTGSEAMRDIVDGGHRVSAGTVAGNQSKIHFNGIRQYKHDASICIFVSKASATTGIATISGLSNLFQSGSFLDFALAGINTALDTVNFLMQTADNTTNTSQSTSVALDTNFHTYKIECGSANIKLTMDGVLEITKTDRRPTLKMEPTLTIKTDATPQKHIDSLYYEAYNT